MNYRSNISSKWSIVIIGVSVVSFSLIVAFFPPIDLPSQVVYAGLTSQIVDSAPQKLIDVRLLESLQRIAVSKPARPGFPIRLTIPKIGVDTIFEYVALTELGEMENPKAPLSVGWYSLGSRPGERGNAVVAGHYGWKNNRPAVFDNLNKLLNGDLIYVEDDKGVMMTFVIKEIRSYGENENATSVFVSNDGKAHLVLITCQGIWNKTNKSYSERLVVFADLLPSRDQ